MDTRVAVNQPINADQNPGARRVVSQAADPSSVLICLLDTHGEL